MATPRTGDPGRPDRVATPPSSAGSPVSREARYRVRAVRDPSPAIRRRREEVVIPPGRSRNDYLPPGGVVAVVDPDELAERAGEREVREETGIDCGVVDVAYVHRAENRPREGDEPPIEEIAVAPVAEYVGGIPRPQESEIREVQWFERLPVSVHPSTGRIVADRL